jgi:hypothetical protein
MTRSSTPPPATVFGVPLLLEVADATRLRSELTLLWHALSGRAPGTLAADLGELAKWWHPKLRGATVRELIGSLSPVPEGLASPFLNDRLWAQIDDQRGIITVEGRIVLAVLDEAETVVGSSLVVSTAQLAGALETAATTYASWSNYQLRDVVGLLRGAGPPMLPQVLALLVLLLVNRSTTRDRGISQDRGSNSVHEVDEAIRQALIAFADAIKPTSRRRDPAHFSLYGGYLASEASRRLGSDLVRDSEKIYIADGREHAVLDLVARDLARRPEVDEPRFAEAFDRLVEMLRGPVGRLALHGSAHEQPRHTAEVRAQLLDGLSRHRIEG